MLEFLDERATVKERAFAKGIAGLVTLGLMVYVGYVMWGMR